MNVLGINKDKIEKCVKETFDEKTGDNKVLREMAQDWQELGVHVYPSMSINDKTFRGRLTPDNALEAVCSTF
jgi:hypothetical protein